MTVVTDVLWGLGGMVAVLAVAVAFSTNRCRIRLRTVGLALLIQTSLGILVLYVPAGQRVLEAVSNGVQGVIDSSAEGIGFLFGPVLSGENESVFAFQVLPVIVYFASLTGLLYYLNVLQQVVRFLGGALAKVLGTTRPESMNAAANIFVGQTEAPPVVRPYIARMSQSELFAVMVGGLATVSGSVLVGYTLLGAQLQHLIAASFMAAPGALLMAKILVPAGSLDDQSEINEDTEHAEPTPVPDCAGQPHSGLDRWVVRRRGPEYPADLRVRLLSGHVRRRCAMGRGVGRWQLPGTESRPERVRGLQ